MLGNNKLSISTKWFEAGSITVQNAELGVTGRDVATVGAIAAANTIKIKPQPLGLMLCCLGLEVMVLQMTKMFL